MLLCFLKHTVPRDDKSEVGYVERYSQTLQPLETEISLFEISWIELYKSTE